MLDHRDLPNLAVFASVVRRGSFTAAATDLGLGKSVVSAQVRALEERSGARLLERTTRKVRLTQAGEQLFQSADKLLVELEHARRSLEAQRYLPTGTLRVASTLELGARFVGPVLVELSRTYPELRIEHHSDDREVDLMGLGVDAAVRLGVPKDSSFVARKLAEDQEVIVASPKLAESYHHVRRPSELSSAPWVALATLLRTVRQTYFGPRDAKDEVSRSEPHALASNAEGLRTFVRGGLGFAALPSHLVADDLRTGQLVRVLPGWYRRNVAIYLLLPARKNLSPRTTVFADAIAKAVRTSELMREASALGVRNPRAR